MYSRKSLRRALVVDLRAVVSEYRESDARKKKFEFVFHLNLVEGPKETMQFGAFSRLVRKLIYISSLQDLLQYRIFGDRSKCYVVIVPRLFVV